MSVQLLRFLAMILGPSITSAARPAVTFLAIQLTVAGLVFGDYATVPPSFAWLVSVPAILVAAVLAGLETAAKHDPDVAALLRDLRVDNVTGAFGTFSAALLFTALGLPETEAATLGEASDLANAVASVTSGEHDTAVKATAIGGAIGLNLGLTWLRSELLEFLDDFDLGKFWARIETGGVLAVLLILPFLPLLAFAFLLVSAIALGLVALTARLATSLADQRNREPCEQCGYKLRREASLCPQCRTHRDPTTTERRGFSQAFAALKTVRKEKSEPQA